MMRVLAVWLTLAVLFGLTYTQAPLYYSNQNQYFLHGLAQGGLGHLHEDWLANTRDPTPLFTALVAGTYRALPEWMFYVYYALVMGVYCGALAWLFVLLSDQASGGRQPPVSVETSDDATTHGGLTPSAGLTASLLLFLFLFLLIHSGLLRWASGQIWGWDYPWYFQAGIAGQYILGPTLQPSTFGVLLVLSLVLFAAGRSLPAVAVAALGGVLHATYLLPAAMLTIAYLYVLAREGRRRELLVTPLLALGIVTPAVLFHFSNFAPTSAAMFAETQRILARFRIPHHCDVQAFFDLIAGLQLAWVGLAIVLLRGTRLFPVLLIAVLIAAGLSFVQIATDSDGLALLFPWRLSSVLVPLATAVILARLVLLIAPRLDGLAGRPRAIVQSTLVAALLALAVSGVIINAYGLGYQSSHDEAAMLAWVKENKRAGDMFLVPVELPKPSGKPGSSSSDFKPLSLRKRGAGLIPIELQRFRLATGAPILIDFKSIPYQDAEVLAWYDRVQMNLRFYAQLAAGDAAMGQELFAAHRITHVVTRAQETLLWPGATLVHEDPHYRIYRLEARPGLE